MVQADELIKIIEEDPQAWFWDYRIQVELFQLLPDLWDNASDDGRQKIEEVIFTGPSRQAYVDDLEVREWTDIRNRNVWERLIRIEKADTPLSAQASQKLSDLKSEYPDWKLSGDEKDDFPFWIESSSGRRSKVSTQEFARLLESESYTEVASILESSTSNTIADSYSGKLEAWEGAVASNIAGASEVVKTLIKHDSLDEETLAATMRGIRQSVEKRDSSEEVQIHDLLKVVPEADWGKAVYPLTSALEKILRTRNQESLAFLLDLVEAAIPLALSIDSAVEDSDLLTQAINHPAGHLTGGLVETVRNVTEESGTEHFFRLKALIEELLRRTEENKNDYRAPRNAVVAVLASRLPLLHARDQDWATQYVIPLFDWTRDKEDTLSAWHGYLWSPHLTPDLWQLVKPSFVQAFEHLGDLRSRQSRLVEVLVVALFNGFPFSNGEVRACLSKVDQTGRRHAAFQISRMLDGAGERAATMWEDTVSPLFEHEWPKDEPYRSPELTSYLVSIALNVGDVFPDAVKQLQTFMVPREEPSRELREIDQSGVVQTHPEATLKLLKTIIADNSRGSGARLKDLLDQIARADESLRGERDFRRLIEAAERS